jgi:chromosome partitioning protein
MYSSDVLGGIIKRSDSLLNGIKDAGAFPSKNKVLERLWTAAEIGRLLNKTSATVARAALNLIDAGNMPELQATQKNASNGQILGYTLTQLNILRRHYNLTPNRSPMLDECLVLAMQTFKGGTGKSTGVVHVAQEFATRGYKVCLIDLDPQASATSLFGYVPDLHIPIEETLTPFFRNEESSLHYAVRGTYWENLDLIPSQLGTNDNEILLAMAAAEVNDDDDRVNLIFNKLKRGIEGLKAKYDIILLDCPPALGMITMNILGAADAVVIPTPPALFDFSSTLQYLRMIHRINSDIDPDKNYKFIKILRSRSTNLKVHKEFSQLMEAAFGEYLLPCEFPHMTEIQNASTEFKTVLEDRRPQKKALAIIENLVDHIELEALKTWPSKGAAAAELEAKLNTVGGENVEA